MLATIGLSLLLPGTFPMSREAFARKLAEVYELQATPDQARRLLGNPDEIGKGGTVWRYGTAGPGTFATLGTVCFAGGKVQDVHGAYWTDFTTPKTPEPLLRAGMQALRRITLAHQDPFEMVSNPLLLVRATNFLWSLGETMALDVLAEYSRVTEDRDIWPEAVAMVLFVPKGRKEPFKDSGLFAYFPPKPRDWHDWPTYPLSIVGDVPLNCAFYVLGGGGPGRSYGFIQTNRSNWQMRATPLRPTSDPFEATDQAMKMALAQEVPPRLHKDIQVWRKYFEQQVGQQTRAKVCRMLAPAFDSGIGRETSVDDQEWASIRKRFANVKVKWDDFSQGYVSDERK